MHDAHFGTMGLPNLHGKLDGWKKLDECRDNILLVVSGTKSLHVVSMLTLWDEQIFVHQLLKGMHTHGFVCYRK